MGEVLSLRGQLLGRESAQPAEIEGGDPSWLSELRQTALAAYRELPWPSSSRDEDWRRTSQIDKLDPAAFQPEAGAPEAGAWLRQLAGGQGLRTSATLVTGGGAGEGGAGSELAQPIARALASDQERWRPWLGSVAPCGLRKFVALNTARFTAGAVVRVPRGTELALPVRLVHGAADGTAAFPRTLVVVEDGASATVLEEWLSPPEARSLLVPVVEVVLGRDARLRHLISQRTGSSTVVQSTVRARVGAGASYGVHWTLTGGAWEKSYFEVEMEGEGSEFRAGGLCIGNRSQHFDVQTLQDHMARGAVSDLLYRAAVAGHSRSVFAGLIRVEEGAQKTNAYVQNRNLLLSPTAKADSNPTLEILANDVRCTHGTAAGRIDEEQLFYCQSRGVTREEARRVVVEGFFADVIDGFPEGEIRELARGWVLEALDQLSRSGALSASPG